MALTCVSRALSVETFFVFFVWFVVVSFLFYRLVPVVRHVRLQLIFFFKTESVIAIQKAFCANFVLGWNHADPDRKSILLRVENSIRDSINSI